MTKTTSRRAMRKPKARKATNRKVNAYVNYVADKSRPSCWKPRPMRAGFWQSCLGEPDR